MDMKRELSEKTLAAKVLTFEERLNKLRRRMALKWVEESIVEKTAIYVGAPMSKYVVVALAKTSEAVAHTRRGHHTAFSNWSCFCVTDLASRSATANAMFV